MIATTEISGFPASRLDLARRELARSYGRVVRAAAKAGQNPASEPRLTVVRDRWESICTGCHVVTHGICGGGCMVCRRGYLVARPVVDLSLEWERPALAGWEFLAVVEPLIGGNLIRRVPHATVAEGELARWERGGITCDHCATLRSRLETFIVRADGSDPAILAGTYRQVGRNCLQAFLGGKSAVAILASIGWAEMISHVGEEGDDGEGGGGGYHVDPHHEPAEFMAWCASSARLAGFVTKKAAGSSDLQATADHVSYLITPQWGAGEALAHWNKAREHFAPNDDDRARGLAALTWARALTGATDYERSLLLVAQQPALHAKHAGLLASTIPAHARVRGEAVKRAATKASPGGHVGQIGGKISGIRATVERIVVVETQYGALHIHAMRDEAGNALVWKTGKNHASVGDRVDVKGTIKAHTEFRGDLQTELSRCTIDVCSTTSAEPIEQHPTADEVTRHA